MFRVRFSWAVEARNAKCFVIGIFLSAKKAGKYVWDPLPDQNREEVLGIWGLGHDFSLRVENSEQLYVLAALISAHQACSYNIFMRKNECVFS